MRQRSQRRSDWLRSRLLIADEPTTALDVTTQRQYLDLLMELQQATGMAIMFVTHDISLVGNMLTSSPSSMAVCWWSMGRVSRCLSQPTIPMQQRCCNPSRSLASPVNVCRASL